MAFKQKEVEEEISKPKFDLKAAIKKTPKAEIYAAVSDIIGTLRNSPEGKKAEEAVKKTDGGYMAVAFREVEVTKTTVEILPKQNRVA